MPAHLSWSLCESRTFCDFRSGRGHCGAADGHREGEAADLRPPLLRGLAVRETDLGSPGTEARFLCRDEPSPGCLRQRELGPLHRPRPDPAGGGLAHWQDHRGGAQPAEELPGRLRGLALLRAGPLSDGADQVPTTGSSGARSDGRGRPLHSQGLSSSEK